MHASIINAPVKANKWDELASLYNEHVVSLVGGDSGILSAHLVRAGDEAISIGIYESEGKALASAEPGGAFADALWRLAHTLAGPPERKLGEVVAH